MRHYVPRLSETLEESLSVYLRVLRAGWPRFLCAFVAVELTMFLARIGVLGDFSVSHSLNITNFCVFIVIYHVFSPLL